MARLTRAQILSKIEKKEAQLAVYEASFLSAGENSEYEETRFNSGEGSQWVTRRSPEEIQKVISKLEREIDQLYALLNHTGIINFTLRRRSYGRRPF